VRSEGPSRSAHFCALVESPFDFSMHFVYFSSAAADGALAVPDCADAPLRAPRPLNWSVIFSSSPNGLACCGSEIC
jgi:hypothetical protein